MLTFRSRLAALAVLIALTASPGEGRAENIFDFLFGADPPQRQAPMEAPRLRAPRVKRPPVDASLRTLRPGEFDGASIGGSGFCVRGCDGYYFPVPRAPRAARQQACEYACPSAAVEFYGGSDIENARNAKGEKYSRLPMAFSFRDKRAEQCTCNRPETSQAFFVRISRTDPTLREGDVIMQPDGALVYQGADFVPVERSSLPSWERQRLRALLDQAARGRKRSVSRGTDPTPTAVTSRPKVNAKAAEKAPVIWVSPH